MNQFMDRIQTNPKKVQKITNQTSQELIQLLNSLVRDDL